MAWTAGAAAMSLPADGDARGRTLVEAAQRGDAAAFDALYRRYAPRCTASCSREFLEAMSTIWSRTCSSPPAGVTHESIRAGRQEMLDRWCDELGLGTSSWWRTWKQQWRDPAASSR